MAQKPFTLLDALQRDAALRRSHHDTSPEQIQAHDEHEKVWNNLRHGGDEEKLDQNAETPAEEHSVANHQHRKKRFP